MISKFSPKLSFRILLIIYSFFLVLKATSVQKPKLNSIERFCVAVSSEETNAQTKGAAVATLTLDIPEGRYFEPDMLREALLYVASTTYRLHAIVSADGKYTERAFDTVGDLDKNIRFQFYQKQKKWFSYELNEVMEQELNKWLDGLKWRMVAFGTSHKHGRRFDLDIVFICDHTLIDGFGMVPVLKNVMLRLEGILSSDKFADSYSVPRNMQLSGDPPPEFEKMLRIPIWQWPLYLSATAENCQILFGPRKGRWEGDDISDDETKSGATLSDIANCIECGEYGLKRKDKKKNGSLLLRLDRNLLKKLKYVGKRYYSSFTSTITAAALVAHRYISIKKKLLETKNADAKISNCQGVAVATNMRAFTTPVTDLSTVGNYFYFMIDMNFCYSDSLSFWKLSGKTKRFINSKLMTRKHVVKQTNFLSPLISRVAKGRGHLDKRPVSVMVSSVNLDAKIDGVSAFEHTDGALIKVHDIFGTSAPIYHGANTLFSVTVVTLNGRSNAVIAYPSPLVQDQDAEMFKQILRAVLNTVANNPNDCTVEEFLTVLRQMDKTD
ncbi:hypothetical protein MP638_000256 [Amoeboaphelidium occidentale]|nr:hypothetical protein MP638_000256 [Amoeboaphelidium occidentale]